jgi:hypothetical protein
MQAITVLIQAASGPIDWTAYVTGAPWDFGEHGCRSLELTIPRRVIDAYMLYISQGTQTVIATRGARILWSGQIDAASLTLNADGTTVKVRALGNWQTLRHGRHTAMWSTTKVDGWQVLTGDLLAGVADKRFETDTNNRLFISTQKNTLYVAGARVGALYFQVPDGAPGVGGLGLAFTFDAPSGYIMEVRGYDAGFTGGTSIYSLTSAGAALSGALCLGISPAKAIIVVWMIVPDGTTEARENGLSYIRCTRVRLTQTISDYVLTTLSANLVAGAGVTATVASTARMYAGQTIYLNNAATSQSEAVTITSVTNATHVVATFALNHTSGETVRAPVVYGSRIAAALLAEARALNINLIAGDGGLIAGTVLDITDASYEDALPADVLDDLARRGDGAGGLIETGVDELNRLYFRPKGSAATAWYVRLEALSLDRPRTSIENRIYATYDDPASDRTLRTASANDSASQGQYGLTRIGLVEASTSSATLAGTIRNLALSDRADPTPAAQIGIVQIENVAGAIVSGDQIRPGDTVTIRNLPPAIGLGGGRVRSFVVSEMRYDPMTRQVSVVPETPLPLLDVLIAQGLLPG